LLEANAVAFGQRRPQPVGAAVGVAVQLPRRALHRGERLWERAQRSLVRGELDDTFEPELPLNLLDRLARLVRNQARERGPDEPGRNVRHATCERASRWISCARTTARRRRSRRWTRGPTCSVPRAPRCPERPRAPCACRSASRP